MTAIKRAVEYICQTMNSVFSDVYEKMCGTELKINSKYLCDYTYRLSEKAVVVQSGICNIQNPASNRSTVESKIKACLSENGALISAVPNDARKNINNSGETAFLDDGMRVMQIIGMCGDDIIINDYLDENGKGVSVPSNRFCRMQGILLEVYK